MSLIFNALRKNRPGSSAVEESSVKATAQRKALSLRTLLSSPMVILILASTIFLSGVVVSYIAQAFTANTDEDATHSSVVRDREQQYKVFVPEPDAPEQGRPEGPPSPEFTANPSIEVIKPIETVKTPDGGSIEFTAEMPDSVDADTGKSDSPPDTLSADPASIPDNSPKKMAAIGDSSMALSMKHDRKPDTARPVSGIQPGAKKDADTVHIQSDPPDSPEKSVLDIQRGQRAKEHLQTSLLAGQIMGAIQSEDHDTVARLFSKMEHIRGKNHHFILKLKAYWMIQQKDFDQARILLSKVLILRPDDIEAGLNMAVVDIMEGNRVKARARLEKLQQLYPEETAIAEYLSQLTP